MTRESEIKRETERERERDRRECEDRKREKENERETDREREREIERERRRDSNYNLRFPLIFHMVRLHHLHDFFMGFTRDTVNISHYLHFFSALPHTTERSTVSNTAHLNNNNFHFCLSLSFPLSASLSSPSVSQFASLFLNLSISI